MWNVRAKEVSRITPSMARAAEIKFSLRYVKFVTSIRLLHVDIN